MSLLITERHFVSCTLCARIRPSTDVIVCAGVAEVGCACVARFPTFDRRCSTQHVSCVTDVERDVKIQFLLKECARVVSALKKKHIFAALVIW